MPKPKRKPRGSKSDRPKDLDTAIRWTGPKLPAGRKSIPNFKALTEILGQSSPSREELLPWVLALEAYDAEIKDKLKVLKQYYGIHEIDPAKWPTMLAIRLARERFRGFKLDYEVQKVGAPKRWDDLRLTQLWRDVEAIKREKSCGDYEACLDLVKRDKRSGAGRYYREKSKSVEAAAKTLVNQLNIARDPNHNWNAAVIRHYEIVTGKDVKHLLFDCLADPKYY